MKLTLMLQMRELSKHFFRGSKDNFCHLNRIGYFILLLLLSGPISLASSSKNIFTLIPISTPSDPSPFCEFGLNTFEYSPQIANFELDRAIQKIQSDPALKGLFLALKSNILSSSELGRLLADPNSLESQFFISYLTWISYRTDKRKIISKEERLEQAEVIPELTKVNLMALFDLVIVQLVKLSKPIPQPLIRILNESIQSGVERTQAAADTHMLQSHLKELAETLEYLLLQPQLDEKEIYLAIMKIAELDCGAGFSVQRNLDELTKDEREFFINLDPNSPLALPTIRISQRDRENIRAEYPGIPFSEVTPEQVDYVVAKGDKWMFNHDTIKAVERLNNGKKYADLSIEEIDAALTTLGKTTLMDRARYLRTSGRGKWGESKSKSLGKVSRSSPDDTALEPTESSELTPTQQNFPIASQVTNPLVLAGFSNVSDQLRDYSLACQRIESLLQNTPPSSPKLIQARTLYRSFINLGLYAPNLLSSSEGVIESLVVATIEIGDENDLQKLEEFLSWRYAKMKDLLWHSHYHNGKTYKELFQTFFTFVRSRENWDLGALRLAFQTIDVLSEVQEPFDEHTNLFLEHIDQLNKFQLNQIPDDTFILDTFGRLGSEAIRFEYGIVSGKISLRQKDFRSRSNKIITIEGLKSSEWDFDLLFRHISYFEDVAEKYGFDGVQYYNPSLHINRSFSERGQHETVPYDEVINHPKARDLIKDPSYIRLFNKDKVDIKKSDDATKENGLSYILRKLGLNFKAKSEEVEFDFKGLESFLSRQGPNRILIYTFSITFAQRDFHFVPDLPQGKALLIQDIENSQPNSGLYSRLLKGIAEVAKKYGFKVLVIETVANKQHWEFYERNGFKPRIKSPLDIERDFYKDLSP